MFSLKLGLIWRSRSNSRLRITGQTGTGVECDVQRTLALRGCLLHKLRSRYAKAVVGNSERVGVAQTCRKSLMELFSNRVRQRRFRFVVDAQNLLSHGVRPASQKAAFGRRRSAFPADNTVTPDCLAAKWRDQRVSRGFFPHRPKRQDTSAVRRQLF